LTLRIELNHGAARCLVLPELGGSLGGWWIAGQAMLRPADEAAIASGDATRLSGFPLVPYSNRIADARFDWHGQSIELAANRSDEPHALHGMGWQRAWQVSEQTADAAVLRLDHPGDAFWPWPLRAEQRITLSADRLTLDLSAVNLAHQPVPLAIGHHPYFPRDEACVTLAAETVWLADARNLPVSSCGKWCPRADSNHRHADFQSAALPTELLGHRLGVTPQWGTARWKRAYGEAGRAWQEGFRQSRRLR
jgi:aldose 1-epimerase